MRLTVDVEGLRDVQQRLQGFSDRRLNAALATGLTRTAQQVAEAQRREMLDVFDRPSRYTLQGVFVCTGIDACARRQDANAKEAQRQAAEILAQLHEPKETDDDQQS